MLIEVLICTHNRVALLERTLEFIGRAACPEGVAIEVLVIANACTDGTWRGPQPRWAGCAHIPGRG